MALKISALGTTLAVTKMGHHRPASKTPFKWRLASGLMMPDIGSFVLFQRFKTHSM